MLIDIIAGQYSSYQAGDTQCFHDSAPSIVVVMHVQLPTFKTDSSTFACMVEARTRPESHQVIACVQPPTIKKQTSTIA